MPTGTAGRARDERAALLAVAEPIRPSLEHDGGTLYTPQRAEQDRFKPGRATIRPPIAGSAHNFPKGVGRGEIVGFKDLGLLR